MGITVAKSAGFCFGVDRAVALVYRLLEEGKKVCTLGPIIHNPQIVEHLKEKGVLIVDDIAQVPEGYIVVIRSHGVSMEIYNQISEKQLVCEDATCPFVSKIHRIVKQQGDEGRLILIAGDETHPEVIGIRGHCITPSFVFKDQKQLDFLVDSHPEFADLPLSLVAQTTFNTGEWQKSVEKLKKLYTNLTIFDTICSATHTRQTEADDLSKRSDLMIVVGGRHSSNTAKLGEVCAKNCRTVIIEVAGELPVDLIKNSANIGVTAGASTPSYIIKEVQNTMSEILEKEENETVEAAAETVNAVEEEMVTAENEEFDFAKAIDETLKKIHRGQRVKGIVVGINPSEVQIDLGTKHAGFVSASEFTKDGTLKLEDVVKKGDELELEVIKVNDQEGTVLLSKEKIDAFKGYEDISAAKEENATVEGTVVEVVNGGVLVNSKGVRVFIPASQTTVSKEESLDKLLKTKVSFKVLDVEDKRGRKRVVGSIRAAVNEEKRAKANAFWSSVQEGQVFTGTVKSLTSYGAFVDLGGVDGMIHVSELSWSRIKNPAEVVKVGDVVEVYVKAIDAENKKISLGYKKAEDNPWVIFANQYHVGDVVKVKIASMTSFGAFATIIDGIDGLIHISQISDRRIAKPQDVLKVGQEVEAKITEIDLDQKRISLSIRALIEEQKKAEEQEIIAEYAAKQQEQEQSPVEAQENTPAEE